MEKAYVILKKGFEYDDNIYSESEGGSPSLIVFSEEDAKKKVNGSLMRTGYIQWLMKKKLKNT